MSETDKAEREAHIDEKEGRSAKKYEIDMCKGPLFGKILAFYIPLMLSGILQLLFNAADMVVVGRFAGSEALAAVGATSSLSQLLVSFFIGLSVGTDVLAAYYYGAGEYRELSHIVHTSILTAFIGGVLLLLLGQVVSKPALILMDTPVDVINYSALYLRIYFLGMPATLVYNFGSAILRAVGDTRRPLNYLLIAGAINVVFNLIFVIVFSLGVAGVAFATVIAQVISAVLVLRCLMQADSIYQLNLKKLRIVPNKLAAILYIGFPAGLQSCIFAISNTLIQSTVNSFGSIAIAGNTAAANLEAFTYTSMNAFSQTAMSFAGQNYGARKYKRILKIALICSGTVALVGVLMSIFFLSFAEILLRLYSVEPEVIRHGLLRMRVMYAVYFLCGMMEVVGGAIRGMGHSIVPMLASIIGGCLFRVFWIYLIFPHFKSLQVLYISYPVSWGLTLVIYGICFTVIYRRCASQDNV